MLNSKKAYICSPLSQEAFAKGMEVYWYDSSQRPFELRAVESWREEWDAVQVCK